MRRVSEAAKAVRVDIHDKKDFKVEQAEIRPFTLMFDDAEMEHQWNQAHLSRHIGLTSRYLLLAALFQGLFYWGDYVESKAGISAKSSMDSNSNIALIGLIRLIIGIITLIGCFMVSTGMLVPTQMTIWWLNICYGIPTLSLFYFARAVPSHWDCLFLIYGLCFFMLPKISPLNFIFGISGAAILSSIFIYISSFRLSMQQWLLSNTFLLMITSLFSYMSFCAEKVSREKWLLRARLRQEKINFRIVSTTSLQDDFNRTVSDERPFAMETYNTHNFNLNSLYPGRNTTRNLDHDHSPSPSTGAAALVGTVSSAGAHARDGIDTQESNRSQGSKSSSITDCCPSEVVDCLHSLTNTTRSRTTRDTNNNNNNNLAVSDDSGNNAVISAQEMKDIRMASFYKGIMAWALCYVMAYTFDMEEVNKSPAFALLMHSMGFSTFLVIVTKQVRWLALNGIVGLTMLWAFNQVGMEQKWVVFSTHSIGYIILAAVIIIMILVFGGVVFVWSHLIDFLKDILAKYPQVMSDLSEDKVLENIIVRYLSDVPKSVLLDTGMSHVLEVFKEIPMDEERAIVGGDGDGASAAIITSNKLPSSNSSLNHKGNTANMKSVTKSKRVSSISVKGPILRDITEIALTPIAASDDIYRSTSSQNRIICGRKPDKCYFCQRSAVELVVPACAAWDNRCKQDERNESITNASNTSTIAMCTPYTDIMKQRDNLIISLEEKTIEIEKLQKCKSTITHELEEANRSIGRLTKLVQELESGWKKSVMESEEALTKEKRQRDEDVQRIIVEHNHQLAELKKLYKSLKQQQQEKRSWHESFSRNKSDASPAADKDDRRNINTADAMNIATSNKPKSSSLSPCSSNGSMDSAVSHVDSIKTSKKIDANKGLSAPIAAASHVSGSSSSKTVKTSSFSTSSFASSTSTTMSMVSTLSDTHSNSKKSDLTQLKSGASAGIPDETSSIKKSSLAIASAAPSLSTEKTYSESMTTVPPTSIQFDSKPLLSLSEAFVENEDIAIGDNDMQLQHHLLQALESLLAGSLNDD